MTEPKPPRVRAWRAVLVVALTIAFVALLILEIAEVRPLWNVARTASLAWVGIAFAYASVGVALSALRWQVVLAGMGTRLPWSRLMYVSLAAWPLATITPSRAGDFGRAWMIRDRVPLAEGAGSVLVERAVDVHTLLLLGLVGGAVAGFWTECAILGGLLVAEWIVVYLIVAKRQLLARLSFLSRFSAKIDGLGRGFDVLLEKPRVLAAATFWSGSIRLLTVAVIHALLLSIGVHIPLLHLVAPSLVATLAGMAPLTLAGMGTRDATFVLLIRASSATVATDAELIFVTLAYSIVGLWSFALIGFPLLFRAGLPRD